MPIRLLIQELRQALRTLVRRPAFTLPTLATLTLGLAAVAVVAAVLRATLFAPLPFAHGDRLVTLDVESTKGYPISLSVPNFEDWKARNRVFESVAAGAPWSFLLAGHGATEVVEAELVLGDWFETLGLAPRLGSLIAGPRTGKGAERVAVLSYGSWQKRFGGDPRIVGQVLRLDGAPYTVLGVLPAAGAYPEPETEIYVPMGALERDLPWTDRDSSFGARAIALRKPGISVGQADADLQRVWREVAALDGKPVARPQVRDLKTWALGDGRTSSRLAALAVLLLFALSAANALHLALARAEERRGEIGVHAALGASRARLARLLGWEALAITGAATALGLLVALGVLVAAAPWLEGATVALFQHPLRIDGGVVLVTAGLAALAALLLTAAPARVLLAGKQGAVLARRRGSRAGLLVTEVAGAVLLVALASLLARSEALVGRVDKGFSADGVWSARLVAPDHHFKDAATWQATNRRMVEAARRIPGVEHAAVTLTLPLSQRSWEMRILPGSGPMDKQKADSVLFNLVSDDSFATLGIPLLRGRGFTRSDRENAPLVAIVDQSMAERYWPGQDPLGKQVVLEAPQTGPDGRNSDEVRTVVGITRNVRHYALEQASRIQIYIPVEQSNGRFDINLVLAVKATGSLGGMEAALRSAAALVDPELAISDGGPLSRFVDAARGPRRQVARLFTAFGLLALLLAAAGVFAVMTHAVASRQGELGIRSALGADARRLLLHVLGGALASGALGALCGVLGGALSARLLGGLLFGVGGFDPRAQLASAGIVLAAVALAALAPALRASRVQPARLLSAGERIAR